MIPITHYCDCELPAVAKFCVRCGARVDSTVDTRPIESVTIPRSVQFEKEATADSRRAEFIDSEPPPPFAYAAGNKFVVSHDSVLPSCCVKCGNPPAEPWLRKTFSWHNPFLYLLIISPVINIIVALIAQKKIKLSVLQKSHLLPRALYDIVRNPDSRNPNPSLLRRKLRYRPPSSLQSICCVQNVNPVSTEWVKNGYCGIV